MSTTSNIKTEFLDLLRFAFITLLIVIPIRMFIAQPFIVNGESMLPTFENGDYLIIDEVSYLKNEPRRGEVIVFHFPTDESRYLIKRIIGLPGETIQLQGDSVTITKADGEVVELDETYTNNGASYGTWTLEEEEYFVMGDNRGASSDSRSWGPLNKKEIVGKTLVRLFPISNINLRPGQVEAQELEKVLEQ
jgi:signal peptidase I